MDDNFRAAIDAVILAGEELGMTLVTLALDGRLLTVHCDDRVLARDLCRKAWEEMGADDSRTLN